MVHVMFSCAKACVPELVIMPPPTDRCVGGIMFYRCRFSHTSFLARDLGGPSADYHQSFPHVRK